VLYILMAFGFRAIFAAIHGVLFPQRA
jgi:hypothetical protein